MTDVLILWDSRFDNSRLDDFVAEFASELSRFAVDVRIVALAHRHAPDENVIKPSMRAVLNLVQQESPHFLITFGDRANSLAALLSPTLKCRVWTNALPTWLDDERSCSPLLARLSKWMVKHSQWGDLSAEADYTYVQPKAAAANGVVIIHEDSYSERLIKQLQDSGAEFCALSMKDFLTPSDTLMKHYGLIVLSYEASLEGRVIDQANAYGMPVLLIAPDGRQHGVIEGETGWVVDSSQQIQFTSCLSNWRVMSDDARRMIAHYCREAISERSGIRQYCTSLGYPERLEYKDFKIRG
ncbi:hypothetical protein [Marinomonas ostreistagni]|uniref:hypothetical protein n=1 Tax=Marinomonas ostreistagni TaxID=359209 RepID=UPI001950856E|nr:hypothetical protein [Marinomonas ostreistagni]MBM6550513.1 hypothetical protein [Marinomonas ostreistagni]